MNRPVVTLTKGQLFRAAMIGLMRHVQDVESSSRYGIDERVVGCDPDVFGAICESAVAMYFNVWLDGALGNLKARDAGCLQVRSTRHRQGKLILHPADADGHPYLLVRQVTLLSFELAGWAWGGEAKIAKNWGEHGQKGRPAFFVDASDLRDTTTLWEVLSLKEIS